MWEAKLPPSSRRTLSLDIETLAAGYADPSWVSHTVTAWAYKWVGGDRVYVDALPIKDLYDLDARRDFISPFLAVLESADVLTFHNGVRFDLPVLAAETLKLRLPGLLPMLVQDTIRVGRVKGTRKGLDNLAVTYGVEIKKKSLNWAEWQVAYAEKDLATVKERVSSDVELQLAVREELRRDGRLQSPRLWKP